jgi:clan AA aspartic protease
MLQGWLREDNQAVVNLEVICRDRSGRTLSAIIDTDFNGQVSLPRRLVNELDLLLTYEGTVEAELADGTSIEEDVYSGAIRFDGQELAAEIIMTDAQETLIGTGLLIGKVSVMNFVTREVTLVSGDSACFLLSQAVGQRCGAPLPTPMPLHPLGQMPRD